jgi:CBS domain-containing protein
MQVSAIMKHDPAAVAGDTSLDEALVTMDRLGIRHLPVVENGQLAGVISDRDLVEATGGLPLRVHACRGHGVPEHLPRTVRDIMHGPVIRIGPEDDVVAAAVKFLARGIGCLPVVQGGELVGMLTEMDLLEAYATGRLDERACGWPDPPVSAHMTEDPTSVHWYTSLGDAIATCLACGVRHLPVLEAGQLVGIVSDRDLRRELGCGRPMERPIDEIVTRDPVTVVPNERLSTAAALMVERRFSSLLVVDGEELVGILTLSDVLEHCLVTCRDSNLGATQRRVGS